ncbi:zinc finger protein 271-like [Maniola jurtina]|uniref:zinc finger protein 271-like n=1 Tax=Maniola jurtina TaxID=191418 RepID=UPI001E688026|nr:zinc finger protein 271-like [Maniola jurtina]
MRCCVPFCNNTSDYVITSDGKGISFHGFPREGGLRVAWLSALGMQGSQLPDSAMICSRHFLDDDICKTEGGFRQLVAGAIPSAVQVCMICLDTDSKLFLMRKHKLEEAYEQLTGHPVLCDAGNLKQTFCVQCAQRLRNFSKFRDKSLRARALMMDLVDKHELITTQHIQMIDRTQHQLKSNIVWTVLGTNPCDLYIEHPSEDKQIELGETIHSIEVKNEPRDDSMSVDGDTEVTNEDDNKVFSRFVASNEGCLSDENMRLQAQLLDEAGCNALKEKAPTTQQAAERTDHSLASLGTENKLSIWKQIDEPRPSADLPLTVVAPLSARLESDNANEVHATEEADTFGESERDPETNNGEVAVSYNKTHINIDTLTNCVVKLYDCKKFKAVPQQEGSLMKTQKAVSSYENPNIDNVPMTTNIKPVIDEVRDYKRNVSKLLQSETDCSNNSIDVQLNIATENNSITFPEKELFICDVCRKMFKQKSLLIKHIQTHNQVKYECKTVNMQRSTALKPYACDLCEYKSASKSNLRAHMRTHTGEKPFTCNLCNYTANSHLVRHLRTHTGEKCYSCNLCSYKSVQNCHLVRHMRTHTGEKCYSCTLCSYKSSQNCHLVRHMRTHTGEKSYCCMLCDYKCSTSTYLAAHMRTHTGEKLICKLCNYEGSTNGSLITHMRTHTEERPYSCSLCEYKSARNSHLVRHMRTHSGIKPYSCKLCDYKCSRNCHLVVHMRTHTGEKPHSCSLCEYKCSRSSSLVRHMKTHTGEKLYPCKICNYKSSTNDSLVQHIRTHTGEKPYSCSECGYKFAQNSHLVRHMRTHTGEKPHACKLCAYRCAVKDALVVHMRSHTGEKRHSCSLCEYKCTRNSHLVKHMRNHHERKINI